MNIHEYQAKAVLREFGVPTPRGFPAFSVDEAAKAAADLATPVVVVKAQIHAGGRGKAGGVKVVKSIDDVKKEAKRLLGSTLVTHQTGPHGKEVSRLYIEEGSAIDKELYLSMLVDRTRSRVAIVVSTAGGMDIEQVAHDTPDKIVTITVDPATNICPHHVLSVSKALGLDRDLQKQILRMGDDTTTRVSQAQWHMPFVRKTRIEYPTGLIHSIVTAATPIDDQCSQIVQFCFRNDTESDTSTADVIRFDRAIVEEDKHILEGTDPDVPLDPRGIEANMASDQPGLIICEMLRDLLAKYGEAEVTGHRRDGDSISSVIIGES